MAWWPHPDPNRDNYYQVRLESVELGVKFQDIHADSVSDAMAGAETLNPGWSAAWAHHQWQSRGIFGPGR